MKVNLIRYLLLFPVVFFSLQGQNLYATEFSDYSFLIAKGNATNINNPDFWEFLEANNYSGIELKVEEQKNNIIIPGINENFNSFLQQINKIFIENTSKVIPVFLNYNGNITVLDSIINNSPVSSEIFYLPQGETWPSLEYLIQAKRRVIFFVDGNYTGESHILHSLSNYVLRISAKEMTGKSGIYTTSPRVNMELFMVDHFNELPVKSPPSRLSRHMIPDYINFLLENWTRYGKRPNFIFIGNDYSSFRFIITQLNSFTWINGSVKFSGKTMEKVYWRNPDVSITGGKFSFPYRGGEEITLSPFVPGYRMTPQQIVVTGEMDVPESYTIIATPLKLSDNLTGSFGFEGIVMNALEPEKVYNGENYSFTQDIERGNVLKLPENASINLGNPEDFGLRNSSFTVSCFVKFTEILEHGDNAVLGNYESEYRRGLHLILRSGHPYFGLYSNDYISDIKLQPNVWYHLVWRYIIETGEQTIFLNGRNIGGSDGHPPFLGTGDIHLGSALSKGASLRGYIDDLNFWSRPLGIEEINRLALNESIVLPQPKKREGTLQKLPFKIIGSTFLGILLVLAAFFALKKKHITTPIANLPTRFTYNANSIQLFGKFKVIDKDANDITILFTPKVKELFLYILIYSVKNESGVRVEDVDVNLWPGIEAGKVANNRAVTLNKLRKILLKIEGIEIVVQNKRLHAVTEPPFFCDYTEAYHLCQLTGEMSRHELETFFFFVKKGRFLKETIWPWLDDMRGLTGSMVIDNLLKLASNYRKEKKLDEIDAISRRILDYDDLNEEAIFLQIWSLQQTSNIHLAKFNFTSFCSKYQENLNEAYPMNFDEFIQFYSSQV
ncbi:MAG TPA: LamG-like jellyroll fold domain-containing protein [Draconibacterium sp.]|nr:LamG-like jellyroll fold domain-containing protein [Draconibacterium sp.]